MKNSLLWRISPPNPEVPDSYIFGTMHLRDLRAFRWFDAAKEKLAACAVFASEFDFSEIDPVQMAQVSKLGDGQKLSDLLGRNAWKSLQKIAEKQLHLPLEILERQHPMMISAALTSALTRTEELLSLDESLWTYANELEKTCTGVEKFSDQIAVIAEIPMELHLKQLSFLVKNYDRQKRHIKKMMKWYQDGNIVQLYKAAKKDAKGMRKIMVYKRNKRMAKRFTEIASSQSLFCAVGAGHLAGQKGLLQILKKQGYKVKPCTPTFD